MAEWSSAKSGYVRGRPCERGRERPMSGSAPGRIPSRADLGAEGAPVLPDRVLERGSPQPADGGEELVAGLFAAATGSAVVRYLSGRGEIGSGTLSRHTRSSSAGSTSSPRSRVS